MCILCCASLVGNEGESMKRLTFEGNFCDIAMCSDMDCIGKCSQRDVWERLKAYEDTGLTPEEVKRLKDGSPEEL